MVDGSGESICEKEILSQNKKLEIWVGPSFLFL
jgi:hypothetical protein